MDTFITSVERCDSISLDPVHATVTLREADAGLLKDIRHGNGLLILSRGEQVFRGTISLVEPAARKVHAVK